MPKQSPKEKILKSQNPVLVDFYADWCAPCQTMNPIIESVLSELNGKIRLVKVNIDKSPQLAQQFGVRSIPHYILFKKGKIIWRKGGIILKRELEKSLQGFA
ncbi:thioredoxin [Algoriphagus sediminis]|uniref:Thioredoxin n=1 Tax=Algoriphagus sediminis TaxID=3057113 RepID=A0ABT7YEG7_9BACT|nr:thioredoxin [Algoriphagus sediminis]MDN3204866.1 thioredoxin [Algoriphagus sediminis]